MIRNLSVSCPLIGAALLAVTPVLAAESQTTGSEVSRTDSAELGEVVVTAQRREESLHDVPQSVSVVSGKLLTDLHATQLTDIGAYVPGLQVDSNGTPGQTMLTIRGIAPVSTNASVALYVDDTPIGPASFHNRPSQFTLDMLPYDIERIEVLEGPQGTLYGANALGGLIKYVTVSPNLENAQYKLGTDGFSVDGAGKAGYAYRGMLNVPLVQDRLGLLASYSSQNTPGFIDSAITNQRDQNSFRQQAARVALLWKASDDVNVRAGAVWTDIEANGNGTVALSQANYAPLFGENKDNNYLPNTYRSVLNLYNVDLDWDLHWAKLLSVSSYANYRNTAEADQTLTYRPVVDLVFGIPNTNVLFPLEIGTKKFTQEVRLQSASGAKLEWLLGYYYDHETNTNHQTLRVTDPTTGAYVPEADLQFEAFLPGVYTENAAFGNLDYNLTDKFDTAFGFRYAKNKQDFQTLVSGALAGGVNTSPVYNSEEGVWTGNVTPRYKFNDNVLSYFRVATGFQPGGPNVPVPGAPLAVKSSTLTSYELGLKTLLPDVHGTLNVALYDIEWKKIQLGLTTAGGFTYTGNGGAARSEGLQLDGSIRPVSALLLAATLNYTDAKFLETSPDTLGFAVPGDTMPFMPKWSGSLRSEYGWDAGKGWNAKIGAGLRLVGKRDQPGLATINQYSIKGYSALDLNGEISNDTYTIRLYAKNVTDERALLSVAAIPDGITNAPLQLEGAVLTPRTIGMALDVKF
jgi:iron complex outermembrane recepter protein